MDWFDVFRLDEYARPIEPGNFAFGLLLTSRAIYNEAVQVFFESNHFVFEDRFSMHMFLTTIGDKNAKDLKSISMHWTKSRGPHSANIKATHREWHLRSELCFGPSLAKSIKELQDACPNLEYLEMLRCRPNIPTADAKDFTSKHYSEWNMVKTLCESSVKVFSILEPGEKFLANLRRSPEIFAAWEREIKQDREIQEYVNEHVRARSGLLGLNH
ncbi:hypothetical protein H2201_008697 [Coniosporium apollinis]|uniref:Uncharacterized protein n=1 Tax=Coniosporium apollinis TaxID=61459 RepID=A0ABQ9NFJ7_9PEZI|nr:hypothetical protein H2201_008697 [Coniosporium apollinis]